MQVEVEVLQPLWFDGKPVVLEEGKAAPIIAMGKADAVYMLADTPTKALHDSVTALLTRPYISLRGANLKYDLAWIERKMGIACTNFRLDTLIAGSLIDETRSNSLNMHAKIYVPELGGYDDEFNRTVDKEKMAVVDRDKLLPYAAGDADAGRPA